MARRSPRGAVTNRIVGVKVQGVQAGTARGDDAHDNHLTYALFTFSERLKILWWCGFAASNATLSRCRDIRLNYPNGRLIALLLMLVRSCGFEIKFKIMHSTKECSPCHRVIQNLGSKRYSPHNRYFLDLDGKPINRRKRGRTDIVEEVNVNGRSWIATRDLRSAQHGPPGPDAFR